MIWQLEKSTFATLLVTSSFDSSAYILMLLESNFLYPFFAAGNHGHTRIPKVGSCRSQGIRLTRWSREPLILREPDTVVDYLL